MSLERVSKRHEIIAHDVVVVVFDVWFNFGVPPASTTADDATC